ncbi:hypothetical protein Tco_0479027 [Tanacetum coccineum]
MLDIEEFTYTVDMFRVTLHLPVETLENPFVAPVNIQTIEAFMNMVGYQGMVDKDFMNNVFQKKETIQIDEDYHSIKDDIPLVSVYTIRNVLVRGMLIPDALLTKEICATDDFKEYETVFVGVDVPMNQPQPIVSTQGTHRTTPRAYRTPTLTASPQGKKMKQIVEESSSPRKSLKITSRQHKVVEGEKDDDDSDDRLEPESHKENPKYVDDDDDEEKVDEKKAVDMGSLETRTEEMQTPIPTPPRSPRIILSSYKNITQELTNTVPLPIAITSKTPHCKQRMMIFIHKDMKTIKRMMLLVGERVKRHKASKSSKSARSSSSKHSAKDSTTYVSKQQQQHEWDAWVEETIIDDDEVILKDETPELIIELQNVDKHVPTIFDRARMEATLNDMLSNQFKNAEEYAYHLEQATSFMENQIVWESRQEDIRRLVPRPLIFFGPQRNPNEPPRYLYNKDLFFLKNGNTEEKKYILSLYKIHAERFLEVDLEERMNRWVRKEFKNFNEDVRITEVVRITTDQPHGLDFMEQIFVMRENDKPNSFSEADFKYMNKNDIEDLYYLCRNKKVKYRETKLMNSLITFIRSRVIWERVHDFQSGIESYQVKVNLTAPTFTFPGIEAYEPYSIVDKPNTGLIYLNNKDEKRVMYLVEIVKFCDATLEKVLKEVKLKIFQSEPWMKPPLLGELDRDIMRAFEREIAKRLSHREQMRRWESFVNGRPVLPTMKRL